MAKIFGRYNFTGVSSAFIIVTVVEHAAPLAEVDREAVIAPYEGSVTFENLNPVMHTLRFYESTDGTTLGNLLISLSIDATIYDTTGVEIYSFEVGAGRGAPHYDPIDGDDTYNNPELLDSDYTVSMEGIGPVAPSDFDDVITGGFQFNTGRVFTFGEKGVVVKFLQVANAVAPVIARPFANIIDLSTDITFGPTHYNNFLRADYAGSVGTITFPAHASIPNYTRVKISTHGGNQNYVKLQFNGAETTKFFNETKNVLYIAKGEEIELAWNAGACFVIDYRGNYLLRGKVVSSYDNTSNRPFLYAHVDTGVLFKTDYPGLYEYIENLPAGVAVALSAWNNTSTIKGASRFINRGRFGIDTATESFRVPALSNLSMRFLKGDVSADTERVNDLPGGYQSYEVEAHTHTWMRPTTDVNGTQYETNRLRTDNQRGLYTGTSQNTGSTGGVETRPENFGQIPLIYL